MKCGAYALTVILLGLHGVRALGQDRKPPEVWSVIVSVETYPRAPILDRPGLIVDGRDLALWMRKKVGWTDHVLELYDLGDASNQDQKPTRANLDLAMNQWLYKRVKPGDVVIFAFAGRGLTTENGEALLPADYIPGNPQGGWSPAAGIQRLIRDKKCSAVLSWIDAPIYDPAKKVIASPEGGDNLLKGLARWPGSSVWLATGDPAASKGDTFLAALRSSLSEGRKPLAASLADLQGDPKFRDFRFRSLGGFPPALNLARGKILAPREDRPAELLVQKGHSSQITAIAVRSVGQMVVTAGEDSTIRVWNTTNPKSELVRVLSAGYLVGVNALALSSDGRYLVGGDGMGQIMAWNLWENSENPIIFSGAGGHPRSIKSLAFLPNDRKDESPTTRFVSLDHDGASKIWEIENQKLSLAKQLAGPTPVLYVSVATNPEGSALFAAIRENGALQVWNRPTDTGRDLGKIGGDQPTAFLLDPEGFWAAVGHVDGQVNLISLIKGGAFPEPKSFGESITTIRVSRNKVLAIGTKVGGIYLAPLAQPEKRAKLETGRGEVKSIEFSTDGRWLAATTATGKLFTWKLGENGTPESVKLDGTDDANARFACIAFRPVAGSPTLVAGENSGGVRRWDLATLKKTPRIAPYRGQVRQLSVTVDGRYLLALVQDHMAQIWDLKEGRTVRTLEGDWVSGVFLRDGRLAMVREIDQGGGVVLIETRDGRPISEKDLPNPKLLGRKFGKIVASKDGRRVAVTGAVGDDVAIVWDLSNGKYQVTQFHTDSLTSIDFSEDGKTLLTGDNGGHLRFWDLQGNSESLNELANPKFVDPKPGSKITAARFGPGDSRRLIVADEDSQRPEQSRHRLRYWDGKTNPDGSSHLVDLRDFAAGVKSVSFLAGGRYAATALQNGSIFIWDLAGPRPKQVESSVVFHHTEQINDLMAWPILEGPTLVSGSDDSTIRFWKIEPEPGSKEPKLVLLGTISSAPEEPQPRPPGGQPPQNPVEAPWVAFRPDGVFDASLDGERLVSFSDGQKLERLDQYAKQLFQPFLTNDLRQGIRPAINQVAAPPPLLIESPGEEGVAQAVVEIKVSVGDLSMKADDLRLYQNETPVRAGKEEFQETSPGSGEFVTKVTLKRGDNQFYAMVGRSDDADARSKDLILYHKDDENPGKLHVISLGINKYAPNGLRYPVVDAQEFSDFVHGHGIGPNRTQGKQILLSDEEITASRVDKAFDELRKAVKGHPEDTVVVFLAGHADLIGESKTVARYSLLLTKFPFNRTDPPLVAFRGPGLAAELPTAPSDSYLPYSTIYKNLLNLDALQRLVIVDACQSEAIKDDPGVRTINQLKAMDRETRQSRTNYFFAARRGEAAKEDSTLNHGLLTYVMLRGMGDPNLKAPPDAVAEFGQYPNADFNHDGVVGTQELHTYVDRILPALASHLEGATRGPQSGNSPKITNPPLDLPKFVRPRVEASGPSFPLVSVPGK